MKYLLPTLFLIASVAADVSHLSKEYLPPLGHHQPHQHAEYAEQTNEVPQVIGANTYTPEHLSEPSNSLVPEASQPDSQVYSAQLQDEDIRSDQPSAPVGAADSSQQQGAYSFQQTSYESEQQQQQQPAESVDAPQQQAASFNFQATEEQQPAESVDASQQQAASFNFQATEEQQPAAQEFVPQTFGNVVHSHVPEQGPAGVFGQQDDQQYEAAASSSGIDTQYGSNGGYVY